ncbi:hypothetical protein HMPREF3034_00606 [Prevotella sp. DNF00663]|uniref:hypothetical protein n=1 Tax=Prevotella sp. DNF00663 TaxID=1384078 RepID=UPI0007954117|nr:hypothetical protein [Prevotella sp. DNF00663]KXB84694.1 hypothetical protein HMPREF3034_00606 [Prevotella sp. DNF00663]
MRHGIGKKNLHKKLFNLLVMLVCSLLLTACHEEEEDNGFPDEKNAVVFNGRIVNSEGIGIKDVKLQAYFIDRYYLYSKTRKKGETKTDQNGNYRLKIYVRADEDSLLKKRSESFYQLTADVSCLPKDKYLIPEDEKYSIELYGERPDPVEQLACLVPEYRKIDVTLTGFSAKDDTQNKFRITVRPSAGFYVKDKNGKRQFLYKPDKSYEATQANARYTIPFAINDSTEVAVLREKDGRINYVWKKVFIGKTSPTSLTFDYNAAD